MGNSICRIHHEGTDYYLEWSSIVDAPITYGIPLEEFEEYLRDEYGRSYFEGVSHKQRMERVSRKGTSSLMYNSVEELMAFNRAGPHESCLTMEEIIKRYIVDKD